MLSRCAKWSLCAGWQLESSARSRLNTSLVLERLGWCLEDSARVASASSVISTTLNDSQRHRTRDGSGAALRHNPCAAINVNKRAKSQRRERFLTRLYVYTRRLRPDLAERGQCDLERRRSEARNGSTISMRPHIAVLTGGASWAFKGRATPRSIVRSGPTLVKRTLRAPYLEIVHHSLARFLARWTRTHIESRG